MKVEGRKTVRIEQNFTAVYCNGFYFEANGFGFNRENEGLFTVFRYFDQIMTQHPVFIKKAGEDPPRRGAYDERNLMDVPANPPTPY